MRKSLRNKYYPGEWTLTIEHIFIFGEQVLEELGESTEERAKGLTGQ